MLMSLQRDHKSRGTRIGQYKSRCRSGNRTCHCHEVLMRRDIIDIPRIRISFSRDQIADPSWGFLVMQRRWLSAVRTLSEASRTIGSFDQIHALHILSIQQSNSRRSRRSRIKVRKEMERCILVILLLLCDSAFSKRLNVAARTQIGE